MKTVLLFVLSLTCINVFAAQTALTKLCSFRSSDGHTLQTVELKIDQDHVQVKESYAYDGATRPDIETNSLLNVLSIANDVSEGLSEKTGIKNLDEIASEIVQAMRMENNPYFGGQSSGVSLKDIRHGEVYLIRTMSNVDIGSLFIAYDKNLNQIGTFYRSGTFLAPCR